MKLTRKLSVSFPLAALLAAALACNSPTSLTPNAITDTPGPTLAPSLTPLLTATQPLVLPATATTTSAPGTPTATQGAPCDNVYLPTTEGSTWTYNSTTSLSAAPGGRTVLTTKVTQDSFFHNVQFLNSPIHYETSWQCTPQGLVEYGGGILAALNASGKVQIDILNNTGVTLPANIGLGDHWSQTTEIQLTSDSLNGTGRWIGNYTAVGQEEVTVPAGTFAALRIDGTLKSESDPYPSLNQTAEGSSWYAPGVGLVKNSGRISGESADFTYELVLMSYNLP